MASFGTDDAAEQLNPDQAESGCFLSSDGNDDHQPDQAGAGFMSDVDQRSDEEDGISIADDDEDDFEWEPEQPDRFTELLTGAIRSFTTDGFTSHAGGADDDPSTATTYSEHFYDDGMDFDLNFGRGEGYQTPDQGEGHQPDQAGAGFVSDDDEGSVDQQTDEEDGVSIAADDEDDFEWEPEQPDRFTELLTGAIRSFTPDGFTSHAGGADDDPSTATTYSEHFNDGMDFDLNFGRGEGYQTPPPGAASPAGMYYSDSEYYQDEMDLLGEDESYLFPVEEAAAAAAPAGSSEAALEAAEAPADDCCPVCLQRDDDGEDDAAWRRVTACGHRFHAACVEQWMRVKPTCPVCRCSAAAPAPAEHASVLEELLALGYELLLANGLR